MTRQALCRCVRWMREYLGGLISACLCTHTCCITPDVSHCCLPFLFCTQATLDAAQRLDTEDYLAYESAMPGGRMSKDEAAQ